MSGASFRYRVRLSTPESRRLPSILRAFAWWLSCQPYGSVVWFSFEVVRSRALPNMIAFALLQRGKRLALDLRDGSMIVVTGENRRRKIAASVADFLRGLATGSTGLVALDTSNIASRVELATWLKLNHAKLRAARSRPTRAQGIRVRRPAGHE